MSTLTARQATERDDAIAQLRQAFPVGSTVSTVVRHVSQSGMQRAIVVLAIDTDSGEIVNVSWQVARALGWSLHSKYDGVKVNGCGMDMAFHLVYTLSSVLHDGNGYALNVRNVA